MGDGARLNRTSVGLKLWIYDAREVETKLPQSNQRGIETGGGRWRLGALSGASIEPAWD